MTEFSIVTLDACSLGRSAAPLVLYVTFLIMTLAPVSAAMTELILQSFDALPVICNLLLSLSFPTIVREDFSAAVKVLFLSVAVLLISNL